jgi:hypothetical protein
MLGKILLWVSGAIFVSYGIACFLSPELPAGYAGLNIGSGDAYAEMSAMYGGLQTGVGVFCIICALTASLQRAGLLLLAIGIGSLAFARLYGAWDADWMVGAYTWGALAYETITAVLAVVALRRR